MQNYIGLHKLSSLNLGLRIIHAQTANSDVYYPRWYCSSSPWHSCLLFLTFRFDPIATSDRLNTVVHLAKRTCVCDIV